MLRFLQYIGVINEKANPCRRSKEAPVKVECMGGCGKYQMIRRSKMNQSFQFVGCMNCEGCRRAEDFARANRAEGTHLEIHVPGHAGVGGFGGWRGRLSTPEHEASFARARALRDAGLALLGKQ